MLEGMIQTPLLVWKDSDVELRLRWRASQGGRTASGWGPQLLCGGKHHQRFVLSRRWRWCWLCRADWEQKQATIASTGAFSRPRQRIYGVQQASFVRKPTEGSINQTTSSFEPLDLRDQQGDGLHNRRAHWGNHRLWLFSPQTAHRGECEPIFAGFALLLVVSGVIDNWQARRLIMQLLAVFIPGYCLCGYHSDDVRKYKYVVGGKICFDPSILIFFKILHCPCFVHVWSTHIPLYGS